MRSEKLNSDNPKNKTDWFDQPAGFDDPGKFRKLPTRAELAGAYPKRQPKGFDTVIHNLVKPEAQVNTIPVANGSAEIAQTPVDLAALNEVFKTPDEAFASMREAAGQPALNTANIQSGISHTPRPPTAA